jgi:GntR family transcriptional regulator
VLRVVRLRVVDDEPMAIERIHLPHALVAEPAPSDMESGSFYHLLRARFGVDVRTAVQTIEPTVTDETESGLLNVPLHAPALLIERTTRDAARRPPNCSASPTARCPPSTCTSTTASAAPR